MATSTIKTASGLTSITVTMGGSTRTVFKSDSGIVTFYWDLYGLSSTNATVNLGTMPEGLRPSTPYVIFSLYSKDPPYLEVGTVWFTHSGTATVYKPTNLTEGYLSGEYMSGI